MFFGVKSANQTLNYLLPNSTLLTAEAVLFATLVVVASIHLFISRRMDGSTG